MCGIMGYVGGRPAAGVLLEGLRRLEYRGYDSAGVAVTDGGGLQLRKRAGKLANLASSLQENPLPPAGTGIGHTRWATHGEPSDRNAHPHTDEAGVVAVVHNGIIENYRSLRQELEQSGVRMRSDTDSEVIPQLVARALEETGDDLPEAVQRVLPRLQGAYALLVLRAGDPSTLVAVRQASPLVIGIGEGEVFVASDIPALLPYTRKVLVLEDGEVAVLRSDAVDLRDQEGRQVQREPLLVEWEQEQAERAGYPHFMLKEIHEQPRAIRDTLQGRLVERDGQLAVDLGRLERDGFLDGISQVQIVACGTAYHAGLVGRTLIERWSGLPVQAEVASEFRYRSPLIEAGTLLVAVSQSGETADTLAALREGAARGARTLAITNVIGSSISREADAVLYTLAGPEVAVASTKAYTTQLVAFQLLALRLAERRGIMPAARVQELLSALKQLPDRMEELLQAEEEPAVARTLTGGEGTGDSGRAPDRAAVLAKRVAGWEHAFYIGRGLDYAVALEGQLKLKEISYIHAEAYAAGELKHGTLALIEPGVPVVALATQPDLLDKTASNMIEVKARGALLVGVGDAQARAELGDTARHWLEIPKTEPGLAPVLAVVPLQLLAYYAAVERGADVDQPRNLAKSVTVE